MSCKTYGTSGSFGAIIPFLDPPTSWAGDLASCTGATFVDSGHAPMVDQLDIPAPHSPGWSLIDGYECDPHGSDNEHRAILDRLNNIRNEFVCPVAERPGWSEDAALLAHTRQLLQRLHLEDGAVRLRVIAAEHVTKGLQAGHAIEDDLEHGSDRDGKEHARYAP